MEELVVLKVKYNLARCTISSMVNLYVAFFVLILSSCVIKPVSICWKMGR